MFFDNFSVKEIFGLAMWFTLRSAVEQLYSNHPVTSNVLSVNEILSIHTKAVAEFLYGGIKGEDLNSRVNKYEAAMDFISSVTTKI